MNRLRLLCKTDPPICATYKRYFQVSRYNDLLEQIKMSLIGLEKGIQGLVVMSSDLEEVFQCINEGKVPGQWLKSNGHYTTCSINIVL